MKTWWQGLSRLFQRIRTFDPIVRRGLLISILCGCALSALEAASLKLFGYLTDNVLTPRDFSSFPAVGLGYLFITAAMIGIDYVGNVSLTQAGQRYIRRNRTTLFSGLLTRGREFFDSRNVGDILTRIDSDVEIAESAEVSGVSSGANAVFQAAFFAVMLFVLDPKLAGLCLVFAPVGVLISRRVNARLSLVEEEGRRRADELMDLAAQSLDAETEVRAFGWSGRLGEQFDGIGEVAEDAAVRAARTTAVLQGLNHLLEMVAAVAVIGFGVWQLAHDDVTLGVLLTFLGFLLELFSPLTEIAGLTATFTAARVSRERLEEIRAPEASPTRLVRLPGTTTKALELHNVGFTYPGHTTPVISGLTATIPTTGVTTISGPSGSGKSTLLALLTGALEPTVGLIRVGGEAAAPAVLAEDTALVPQRPTLFTESVLDNVRRAVPGCSDTQLASALERSGVAAMAHSLPDGLNTPVGPNGRTLSGGQRQRIALARALLRDRPRLVLDEPTAGLDPEAASFVMDTIDAIAQHRCVLLVTHDDGVANQGVNHIRLEPTRCARRDLSA